LLDSRAAHETNVTILKRWKKGLGKVDDPDQIERIMAEEKRRGRRPTHSEARKRKLERLFTTLLDRATEEEFLKAMRDLGLSPDSEQHRDALKIWRENRRL
jgi:ABC-type nitrate/sulfonate/bicarbonate transport system substrate-binding protein